MKDFRDLRVWQKAHELTLEIYRLTEDFHGMSNMGSPARFGDQRIHWRQYR
jgi:hypothetical protein